MYYGIFYLIQNLQCIYIHYFVICITLHIFASTFKNLSICKMIVDYAQ